MIDKFITVLFIQSILFSFYLGQILSVVRLKICPPRTKFVKSQQTILQNVDDDRKQLIR